MKQRLDVSNGNLLDSEEYSNFRFLGIGKPSKGQIERWEEKKPEKIEKLLEKGVITEDDTQLDEMKDAEKKKIADKLGKFIKGSRKKINPNEINVIHKSTGAGLKSQDSTSSDSSNSYDNSYQEKKPFFKTKTGIGVLIGGGILLIVGGYLIYKKVKK